MVILEFFLNSVRGLGLKGVCIHVLYRLKMEKFMERFDFYKSFLWNSAAILLWVFLFVFV